MVPDMILVNLWKLYATCTNYKPYAVENKQVKRTGCLINFPYGFVSATLLTNDIEFPNNIQIRGKIFMYAWKSNVEEQDTIPN